jgi:intracellular sulfur oxidation DsrE/DsrF family protein
MSHEREVSREMQNAFVDGQLDAADWTAMVERMGGDEALRRRVCELRTLKDMTRGAYAGVHPRRAAPAANRWGWAHVAGLALVFALAGWLGHAALERGPAVAELYGASADRILVHVASSRGEVVDSALQEVEDYLRDARAAGRRVQVEIVANNTGMDILRVDTSAYAKRLERLRTAYPNLTYIACNQTADRLREKGIAVELLPGVHVAPTALDEIVKRMQQGWVYIRA